MQLKNSSVARLTSEIFHDVSIDVGKTPELVSGQAPLVLNFDFGSASKKELAMIRISSSDFGDLASVMMRVNRDAAIKAFAAAILEPVKC